MRHPGRSNVFRSRVGIHNALQPGVTKKVPPPARFRTDVATSQERTEPGKPSGEHARLFMACVCCFSPYLQLVESNEIGIGELREREFSRVLVAGEQAVRESNQEKSFFVS